MCEIVEIRTVNLQNADSIIVVLKKYNEHLVILIDTGRDFHLNIILGELDAVLKKYNKQAAELVICTHFDFDHIGGLASIVGRYKIHVKEVWMHKTSQLVEIAERLEHDGTNLFLPGEDANSLHIEGNGIIDYDDDDIQDILENLLHEKEAIAALGEMGIKIVEPIAGHCSFDGWPEIQVIAPSFEYYKQNFPEHFDFNEYLNNEKAELKADIHDKSEGADAFEKLDNFNRKGLTATNLNSAIILIETAKGKYLFTGDAGIESFMQIPNFETVLGNLHFLKVPHHGSANNLNSELIKIMKPEIAFISGGSYVSEIVVDVLQETGAKVLITRDEQTLVYPLEVVPD